MAPTTPRVEESTLLPGAGDAGPIVVGTPAWFAWLESATNFAFRGPAGSFTARKESRARGGWYWKAYRSAHGRLQRVYLGKSEQLTLKRLNHAASALAGALAPAPPAAPPLLAAPAAPPQLLATKLFVPPARATLAPRPRLFARLQAGLRGKLTVVAAPAGFGKTTLLSAWRATVPGGAAPFAWVSIDAADNDPLRFWSYVIAALDTLAPGAGATALVSLQSPQPPPLEGILISVLNAVGASAAAAGQDVTLTLDDYHVITAPAIHQSLALLIDYLPPALHLVILTRADPALPLARMRANGTVTELHAADLRFTAAEAAAFLNDVMGLALSGEDVAALEARTEGWIAGLQLAALAMRDHSDRAGFIRTFSGSNRYIVDYLAAEVFARQPEPVQTFLLRTAILDRMCGPLCDTLLAPPDADDAPARDSLPAGAAGASGQSMLEDLERANLFVVPLDDDRVWYRYHHLFAEVLRQQLKRHATPATVAGLHGRASAWYEQQGLVGEAVRHALAADHERAAQLIERYGLRVIVGGGVQTALNWLGQIPEAMLLARPFLLILHSLALLFNNEPAAAEARLEDAERTIRADTPPAGVRFTQGNVAAIRANMALYSGDLAGCIAYGERVLALLPESEVIARTTAQLHVARAFRVSGDVTQAEERRAVAAIAPIRATGSLIGTIGAVANLARLQILQGRRRAAAATLGQLDEMAGGPDELRGLHGGLAYHVGMGELRREWNELDAAAAYLAAAMALLPGTQTVDADDVALGYLALARLQHARGEHAAAEETLLQFREQAERRGFVTDLQRRGTALRAQLALAAGDLPAAIAWAGASGLAPDDNLAFRREAEYLLLARVWIAQAQAGTAGDLLAQALRLLDRLLADAAAKDRQDSALEILIVRALGLRAQAAHPDALTTLAHALALGAREGYVRRFVDEGPAMCGMLREAVAGAAAPDYIALLLAAFEPGTAMGARKGEGRSLAPAGVPAHAALREPLSEREREVLRLVASGQSNAEVARALVIAVSTVKTHTNSIFGKLGVTSRTQAIARARALDLL
jgi:LuxR family transcriptional regulator, maltose regulon positive regulatory protein